MAAPIITIILTVSIKQKLALEPKFYLAVSKMLGKDAIASAVNARKNIVNVLMLVSNVDLIVNAKIVLTDHAKSIKINHLRISY